VCFGFYGLRSLFRRLRIGDQSPAAFDALLPELKAAIAAAMPGTVTLVGELSR